MKLFISYSRDDTAWVNNLHDALRSEGDHAVWIDRGLVAGQDWWQTILENIEACECFVYVMTPKAIESIYCRAELDYALALNKPVLPLRLKECDYPVALQNIQYQSITNEMSMYQVLLRVERGLNAVQRDIERGRYVEPTPRPPRPGLPTPAREPEQVSEVFMLAEDAAAANNVPLAEKLFKQVMDADPQGWGVAAAERLADIRLERERGRDYLAIVQMAANPAKVKGAQAAARVYAQKYGQDYDPRGILPQLLAPVSPPSQPATSTSAASPTPVDDAAAGWNTAKLRETLNSRVSLDELRNAALDLRVEYEGLEKGELVRRMILSLEQRRQLDRLIDWLQTSRMDIDTSQFKVERASSPTVGEARGAPPIEVGTPPPAPKPAGPNLGDRMTDSHGVTMVYVPPGKFTMGAADITDNERPPHEVVIAQGFWLDLTPVTNAMYAEFVTAGGYKKQEFWTRGGWEWVQKNKKQGPQDYKGFTDAEQPRVGVTWFEAYAYCQWRGGRLPPEAEWEWAARGPENRTYPWGNEFDASLVVFRDNSGLKTAPVNPKTRLDGASWVGALDMSGNVWEWTSSLYRPYPYKPEDGRESLDDAESARVVRGGSWYLIVDVLGLLLQAAVRFWFYPSLVSLSYGLRCARSS